LRALLLVVLGVLVFGSAAAYAQFRISLVPEQELLTNGGFEIWPSGSKLPVGWEVTMPGRENRIAKSRDDAQGLYAVRLEGGVGVAVGICQTASAGVRGGATYQVGLAAKGTTTEGRVRLDVILTWFDALGAEIGSRTVLLLAETGVTNYRGFSEWFTSPDSAAGLRIALRNPGTLDVLIDSAFLRVYGA
jgi:hypothetical protein